ncbi:MAG: hypothetical protein ACYDAY_00370 [Candidatus Dormibacteria bacterium]
MPLLAGLGSVRADGTQVRNYVAGTGGVGASCLSLPASGLPGPGSACFDATGAASVVMTVTDRVSGSLLAGYGFLDRTGAAIAQGTFCGSGSAPVPPAARTLAVAPDAGSACGPEGVPTTGTIEADFSG